MPRYFFELTNNGTRFPDDVGTDLEDDAAARLDALSVLGQYARDQLPGGDDRILVVDVLNEQRRPLLTANLSLIVTYAKQVRPRAP